MTRLAGVIDGVIGVDTHRDTLAAVVTDMVGGLLAQTSVPADGAGYRQLFEFARVQVPGRRCWAVEGAGSYGAGLAAFLQARGEQVVEVARPKRSARRTGAKSDALDAVRAAREALAQDHLLTPRRRGDREALRVLLATRHSACAAKVCAINQLKALIVGAPDELRAELRGLATKRQIMRCARLRDRPARSLEHRMTIKALRLTAQRIQRLAGEAAGCDPTWSGWWPQWRRGCWRCPVWGRSAPPRCWSAGHMPGGCARRPRSLPGRRQPDPGVLRAGHPARLNRSGDRQLNRALHTVVVARLRDDPDTHAYAARRTSEGKSARDIRRCLKRAVARQLFKLLEHYDRSAVEVIKMA